MFSGALVNWWKPETNDNFQEKAQCIIWQYGNYTVDQVGLELNGVNTQGENIADNGGIKEAYKGYGKNTFCICMLETKVVKKYEKSS